MENQKTTQAVLTNLAAPKEHKTIEKFALFVEVDGELFPIGTMLTELEARVAALEP